jgi:PAS domain S-box-containing protein
MSEDELTPEEAAAGFEDPEEETSPEHMASGPLGQHAASDPLCVVCTPHRGRRLGISQLLGENGWKAVEAKSFQELLDTCKVMKPEVVLVDSDMGGNESRSIPELVRDARPDDSRRVVALLGGTGASAVASAVAEGYDDLIMDPDNQVELLARTTSNLRAVRAMAEVQQQRRDAATLLELSQTLASSLDLQLILHTVSRLIADVVKLERCSIIILDPDNDDAIMVAASEDREVRDLRISLPNYPELQRAVSRAAPVIIEDAMADPLLESVREKTSGVRMMALFPIVFEERVTGVLFLRSHKVSRQLTDHEVQFGQTVASACAVAIRNARLFDSFRDQTERINYMRMVAEKQMEALKKYEDFFEYAADGMAIVDSFAEILYVNREGRKLIGRERHELTGLKFTEVLAEESRHAWEHVVETVRLGRFHEMIDLFLIRGDGSERIFSASAGGGGQETGLIILSFRDVTETREMEMELRTTKDFLENLIDNSIDAIVAADMSGNIMLFNKGAEKVYGYRAEEVIGRLHVSELYPDRGANEIMRQLRDPRWGGVGKLEAQRKLIKNSQGGVVPVSMTSSIIYEDGEEVATVGVFTDLRDRLRIEKQLNEAQAELIKTEKARVAAELAGMAAHELNQPLTSVLGYAEMLRHRVPEEMTKVRKHVDTIYGQAERMAEIVRKIGKITKYETTHYTASTMMMDLNKSVGDDDPSDGPPTGPFTKKNNDTVITGPVGARSLRAASGISDEGRPAAGKDEFSSKGSKSNAGGILAALAKGSQAKKAASDDPRAAVVQLDTIDDVTDPNQRRHYRSRAPTSPGRLLDGDDAPAARSFPRPPPDEDTGDHRSPTSPGRRTPLADEGDDVSEERTNPGVRLSDLRAAHDAAKARDS